MRSNSLRDAHRLVQDRLDRKRVARRRQPVAIGLREGQRPPAHRRQQKRRLKLDQFCFNQFAPRLRRQHLLPAVLQLKREVALPPVFRVKRVRFFLRKLAVGLRRPRPRFATFDSSDEWLQEKFPQNLRKDYEGANGKG
jgi:hypothetical protein